jgi:hypothetical protein
MNDDDIKGGWHLDRRISAGTLIGLVLQAVILATWVGALDKQVKVNTSSIVGLKEVDQARNTDMRIIEGRLSSLETTARQQLKALERIERILDRKASQ